MPPFAPMTPALEVIDQPLLRHERILFPAGDHRHSVLVDPREIVRINGPDDRRYLPGLAPGPALTARR